MGEIGTPKEGIPVRLGSIGIAPRACFWNYSEIIRFLVNGVISEIFFKEEIPAKVSVEQDPKCVHGGNLVIK